MIKKIELWGELVLAVLLVVSLAANLVLGTGWRNSAAASRELLASQQRLDQATRNFEVELYTAGCLDGALWVKHRPDNVPDVVLGCALAHMSDQDARWRPRLQDITRAVATEQVGAPLGAALDWLDGLCCVGGYQLNRREGSRILLTNGPNTIWVELGWNDAPQRPIKTK